MDSRGYLLLDYIELFLSIIGVIIFSILFIIIPDKQKYLFLFAGLYLIYNCYSKFCLLNIFKKKTRIIKYYGKKISL